MHQLIAIIILISMKKGTPNWIFKVSSVTKGSSKPTAIPILDQQACAKLQWINKCARDSSTTMLQQAQSYEGRAMFLK